ncbi:hypothetical protein FDA09_11675 [Clostridium botulinum]|uniref:hypothetical protein n=1 Tax=Clostridium botulinum TaxID=1491 RepID=UPI000772EA3E|nr:hypothetical protein [Clostridium botulinum]NFF80410.1 hypothetical protein [Clostridium botulinum]NFH80809.1 hypothetical protein [Clostridium botulinum]NFH83186.1 hypothetical protein [Clostridium botulinum]NFI12051.1 hypothetical protein [Clostridium botulinum]NFI15800.1 hypothetical protein [Clostridium botulinum]
MENHEFIDLYYGTINPDIITKYPIDPCYNSKNIFEFGNGFYLSLDKNISQEYIRIKLIDLETNKDDDEINILSLINGDLTVDTGYLHKFKLDFINMTNNEVGYTFESSENLREVLKESINNYSINTLKVGYSPNRHYTFGPLCGSTWDKYWTNYLNSTPVESITLAKDSLDKFLDTCISEMNGTRQLCIHKRTIGNSPQTQYLKYFEYMGYDYIKYNG